MSIWTHITGSVSISCSAMEFVGEKMTPKLPYPNEQMRLGVPRLVTRLKDIESDATEAVLKVDVFETSLPILKKKVDELIHLLPEGEWEHIDYNIYQSEMMSNGSSSYFRCNSEKKQFKKLLTDYGYSKYDQEDIELGFVNHCDTATLTILDDVRYCSGETMMESMVNFFKALWDAEIYTRLGYFEWVDEYDAWRTFALRIDGNTITKLIIDTKGNVTSREVIVKESGYEEEE